MSKSGSYAAITLLAVLPLLGCGGKEKQLVGHYSGSIVDAAGAPVTKGAAGSMTLDLKADKTFVLPIEEGTWEYADSKIVLTPSKFMGTAVSESQAPKVILDVGADDTLTMEMNSPSGQKAKASFIFKKVPN